jgi:hypothetical protein
MLNLDWIRYRCGPNQNTSLRATLAAAINSGPGWASVQDPVLPPSRTMVQDQKFKYSRSGYYKVRVQSNFDEREGKITLEAPAHRIIPLNVAHTVFKRVRRHRKAPAYKLFPA